MIEHSNPSISNNRSQAWLVCLAAGFFFFYEFFQLNLFDVINEPLRQAFQLDAAQLSWMSSMYLWADIIFLLPAGIILDRYSTRHVILFSMALCIFGTIGFGLTHSFYLASFYHFLSGIGNAFCFLSCIVLVSRWFPPRRQAFVVGCLVTMAFIGGMMAHTPFAYLNEQYGWRQSLLIDGLIGVVFFLFIYLTVQNYPQGMEPKTLATKPHWGKSIFQRQNWLAGLYTSCLNLPILVLCALWGVSYLEIVHGVTTVAASNIVSLIFIGSMIGCPLVGFLSDKLGRRKPLMMMGALATLLIIMPLFTGMILSPFVLSVLFFSLGFVTSTQVISYPLITESNSPEHTGAATGVASTIVMGGGGVGQVLFGQLMKCHATTNHYIMADFQFAMWLFPIATVIAIIALSLIQETYCQRNHSEQACNK